MEEYSNDELVFRGGYEEGLRHGLGTVYHVGGGETDGKWAEGSLIETIVYRYPCRFGLELKEFQLYDDISTETVISKEPLRPDPYETQRVYVKKVI